jgi:hypothetical protein
MRFNHRLEHLRYYYVFNVLCFALLWPRVASWAQQALKPISGTASLLRAARLRTGVAKLSTAINTALTLPEVKTRLSGEGAYPTSSTPAVFGKLIESEIKRGPFGQRRGDCGGLNNTKCTI